MNQFYFLQHADFMNIIKSTSFITQIQCKGLCHYVGFCFFSNFIKSFAAALLQNFQPQNHGTTYWESTI